MKDGTVAQATPPRAAALMTVQGDGITLAADRAGDPEGVGVLFLHGGGQTRHAWKRSVAAAGEAGFDALAVDLRGHGDSDWSPGGDYRLDRFADDVRAVAAGLSARPFLVGASLGGLASLVAVGEAPSLAVRGLVLVDIAPHIQPVGAAEIGAFMRSAPDGFASLDAAADAVASYLPHRPRPGSVDGLKRNLREGEDGRWRWHWDPAMMAGDRRTHPSEHRERLEAAAARIKAPVLLIRGGRSRVVTSESVASLRHQIPHLDYVEIPEADHMVAGDRNDRFTIATLAFLRQHR